MRTLCLTFSTSELQESQAELFLPLTPSIVFRSGWLFLEVSATSHLHGGEEMLVQKALRLAQLTGAQVEKWALAGTPYGAQALCEHFSGSITSPLKESQALADLPLEALLSLEGLKPWESPAQIRGCIDFFYALGFHQLGQILSVSAENFGWRWGTLGQMLWRRLHHKEVQSFPFLVPQSPLKDYAHLDHPADQLPLALHEIQKILERLVLRLEGRRLWAWRWHLTLHCEYSGAQHKISLQPSKPHRSLSLAMTMLEHRLSSVDLSNPLQEVEVDLDTCPESTSQLDFFEPRTHQEEDELYALLSLLGQEDIPAGFFQVRDHIFPEKSFELTLEREPLQSFTSTWLMQEGALRYLPRHSESLQSSPRPCCFLKEPRRLSGVELSSLHFLSSMPLERLQSPWWTSLQTAPTRDYFVARSSKGQSLWIYQDTQTHEYYLHGYFD